MENIIACDRIETILVLELCDGMVNSNPGLKITNRIPETIKSVGVSTSFIDLAMML